MMPISYMPLRHGTRIANGIANADVIAIAAANGNTKHQLTLVPNPGHLLLLALNSLFGPS